MMSAVGVIGNMLFASGYDVVIDQTQTGYIYFGFTASNDGTIKSTALPVWSIIRLAVTNSNKLNWFRHANGWGIQTNQVWNSNGNDDVYNGTATF